MSPDPSLVLVPLGSVFLVITAPEKPFLPLTINSYLYLTPFGFVGQKWKIFCAQLNLKVMISLRSQMPTTKGKDFELQLI